MNWRGGISAGLVIFAVAIALGTAAKPASAASILINQGNTTYDPDTGLQWLDLTETAGQSYDAVLGGYGGYIGAGWRFATGAEVTRLYDNAGGAGLYPISQTTTSPDNNAFTTALTLALLLGGLSVDNDGGMIDTYSIGLLADPANGGARYTAGFIADIIFNPSTLFVGALDAGGYSVFPSDATDQVVGSFLVKGGTPVATTPIPPALFLFISALTGLGFAGWRRKTRITAV